MVVWQLSSVNKLVYTCTATVTSICKSWLVGGKHVLPYLVIVLSRFLAKGWFTCSIEHCTRSFPLWAPVTTNKQNLFTHNNYYIQLYVCVYVSRCVNTNMNLCQQPYLCQQAPGSKQSYITIIINMNHWN